MHEIVTLQFGNEANYLGTHFWNIQESYFTYTSEEESAVDHDVQFRPGIGADGADTFTPRCLVYDLKSNFGSLRQINALYESLEQSERTPSRGNGSATVIRQSPVPPHPYQQHLDQSIDPPQLTSSTVRYWSDYNRVFYHPRSLVPISIHDVPASSHLQSFSDWSTGEELFESLEREHDLFDRDVRYFAEECDQLQGFQIFASSGDAWGGWTLSALLRLRDDFGKIPVWIWALESMPANSRASQQTATLNSARSLSTIAPEASLYTPLSASITQVPPYLNMDHSLWQASALQAAAVETVTLPSRLRPVNGYRPTLADLEMSINRGGARRVATLESDAADPAQLLNSPSHVNGVLHDHRMTNGVEHEDETATPEVERYSMNSSMLPSLSNGRYIDAASRDRVFGRAESLRGAWASDEAIEQSNLASRDRFSNSGPLTISKIQTPLLFPILSSFPHIFNLRGTADGSLAMRAALSTTSQVAQQLRTLSDASQRVLSMAADDRSAMSDSLQSMAEEYVDGFEDDDMSEDDNL